MKKFTLLFFTIMMVAFSWQGNAQTYCIPIISNNSNTDNITNVTFAGIDNTTTNHNKYHDFTAKVANVTLGETYTISVSGNSFGGDQVDVFIDWNHSGWTSVEPLDAGEHYRLSSSETGEFTLTEPITVPIGASLGDTRMRVRTAYHPNPDIDPCGSSAFGEVEDYTVNVSAAPDPISGYVYDNGWIGSLGNPNDNPSVIDDITVINGDADFTENIVSNNLNVYAGATLKIKRVLNISDGSDVTNNGEIIFLSDADGDGELGPVDEESSFEGTGIVTTHRYMSDHRAYRMVSSSVTTTTSIHDNWQEGATSYDNDPNPGFGTHITGIKEPKLDQTDGFDITGSGNPSMFTVNVAEQAFVAVTNTDVDTLTAGEPYLLFVRGGRDIDLTENASHGSTTLRASGELAHGFSAQVYRTDAPGQLAMFGNPYQSAVDMTAVLAASDNANPNFYYVYDPTLATQGGYVTVNLDGSTNTSGSEVNQYLQVGQAGQVANLDTGDVVVGFHQINKAPGQHTRTNATGNQLTEDNMLSVQLYTTERFNNGGSVHDSFGIIFDDNESNELTPKDAIKPMNFYENFGIDHNGTYLSIERREMPQAEEVYSLYSTGYSHSDYTLKMIIHGLEDTFFYLDDSFTGTSTLLESGETTYSFSIDANDELSIATDRFSIRTEGRLSVNDNSSLAGLRLYPNPLNDNTFYINAPKLDGETVTISVNDILGREIFNSQQTFSGSTVKIDLSQELKSGIYMVNLSSNGADRTLRVIKG